MALAAGWLVACGSASTGSDGYATDAGVDTGALDAAGLRDTTTFEAGRGEVSAPQDGAEAGADGGLVCSLPVTISSAAGCSSCVEDYCDPAWCACAQDTGNVDSTGANGCERYVACVLECVLVDAGLPTVCAQAVCAHAPFTSEEQQEGRALLDCMVLPCSTVCPE